MRKSIVILLLAPGFVASALFAQESKLLTTDQLVAKNIEAKGGIDAIHALKTLKLTGKLLVNGGQLELGYVQTKRRPGEVRTEATLQGMTMVQAFDGKDGWKISPFQGRKDPEKLSADDTKSLVEDAEIAGPLVDWKEKGSKVEYLGTEDVDGTMAHKLKVTRENGDVNYVYLDPDHFLEIRTVSQRNEHGAQVETETDYSDYEKVGGVYLPLAVESGRKGSNDKQKLIIEKADPNPPVEEKSFDFPATTPAPSAKPSH